MQARQARCSKIPAQKVYIIGRMLAAQAKKITSSWVEEFGSQIPGFAGAFFHGSINWLADDALLPSTSDVDVLLVVETPPAQKIGKLIYRGVIIEASYLPAQEVSSAEHVLGLSHLAGSLRGNTLIADPTGHLRAIQQQVTREYAWRKWVTRRCQHALDKARAHLQSIGPGAAFPDQVISWLFGTGVTTHILLAAGLQNPTVRKRYLDVRGLLERYGRLDFHEFLLDLLGCAHMQRKQVEQHLTRLAVVFDEAQSVIRSPFSFAADISPLARPVAIDGSRELIEGGNHREAVFWIAVTYSRCMQVFASDGTPQKLTQHDPGYRALLAELNIHDENDLQRRRQLALDSLPRVWEAAQAILRENPDIIEDLPRKSDPIPGTKVHP